MRGRVGGAVAAELVKIWTLPAAAATALGTALAAALLTGVVAASADGIDAVAAVLAVVPPLQVGPVLLGVLIVASEYSGTQARTTLTAVPDRTVALVGKTTAFLVAVTATSAASCAAGLVVARVVAGGTASPSPVAGAAAHLALIGLLAFALALLLRALVPALVGALGTLLVVPPMLASVTEHARWLPDRAGSALYLPDSAAVLAPGVGLLVLVGWITVVGGAAAWAFLLRDA
ncbi:hypothetical protein [Pseudonocardia lacus]|uniref:hypothetical protein n=1 Tax=Pseudonocardia lacus TaxID=2835865 RepID=UPI001BDCB4E9|nr:hypothetical protein [Pseudonocardia lacus]